MRASIFVASALVAVVAATVVPGDTTTNIDNSINDIDTTTTNVVNDTKTKVKTKNENVGNTKTKNENVGNSKENSDNKTDIKIEDSFNTTNSNNKTVNKTVNKTTNNTVIKDNDVVIKNGSDSDSDKKGPKGGKKSGSDTTKGPKGPKKSGSDTTKGPKGPKNSGSDTFKGPKGPKNSGSDTFKGPKGPKNSGSDTFRGPRHSDSDRKGPHKPRFSSDSDSCFKHKKCKHYNSDWEKPCKYKGKCGKFDSDWDFHCEKDACRRQPKWKPWGPPTRYHTRVLPYWPVYCPKPTEISRCGKKVWVPAPTTYTVHDCPCTVTEPEYEPIPTTLVAPPPAAKVEGGSSTLYTPVPTYPAEEGGYEAQVFTGAAAGNGVASLGGLAAALGVALYAL